MKKVLILLLLFFLSGCSFLRSYYIHIPLPIAPNLSSVEIVQDKLCFSQSDADKLDKFFDQFSAYKYTIERLQ